MACSNCDCKVAEDIFPSKNVDQKLLDRHESRLDAIEDSIERLFRRVNAVDEFLGTKFSELNHSGFFETTENWSTVRAFQKARDNRLALSVKELEENGYVVTKK